MLEAGREELLTFGHLGKKRDIIKEKKTLNGPQVSAGKLDVASECGWLARTQISRTKGTPFPGGSSLGSKGT